MVRWAACDPSSRRSRTPSVDRRSAGSATTARGTARSRFVRQPHRPTGCIPSRPPGTVLPPIQITVIRCAMAGFSRNAAARLVSGPTQEKNSGSSCSRSASATMSRAAASREVSLPTASGPATTGGRCGDLSLRMRSSAISRPTAALRSAATGPGSFVSFAVVVTSTVRVTGESSWWAEATSESGSPAKSLSTMMRALVLCGMRRAVPASAGKARYCPRTACGRCGLHRKKVTS